MRNPRRDDAREFHHGLLEIRPEWDAAWHEHIFNQPIAHDKIKLGCEVIGVVGTLIAGLVGRARLARQT